MIFFVLNLTLFIKEIYAVDVSKSNLEEIDLLLDNKISPSFLVCWEKKVWLADIYHGFQGLYQKISL